MNPVEASSPGHSQWRLGYRPALDGIRGIAVLAVMGYHFFVPGFSGGGYVGVTMFFTLSGFLITALLIEERSRSTMVDIAAFYWRRARRLLPALLLLLFVVVMLGALRGRIAEVGPNAAAVALYVGNWAQLHDSISIEHLSHTWSLAVEEQFYLVWPWLFVLAAARSLTFVIAIAIALAALALRLADVDLAGLDRIDALMVGCALAVLMTRARLGVPALVGWAAVAALAPLTVLPLTGGWDLLAVALATAALIAALEAPSFLRSILEWRALVSVGRISYGLYLWHFAVGWEVWPHVSDWHWAASAALLTALSFVFALLSWRYVEQPMRRAKGFRLGALVRRSAASSS